MDFEDKHKSAYANYSHNGLPDVEPGYDPDFEYPHLDPPELANEPDITL